MVAPNPVDTFGSDFIDAEQDASVKEEEFGKDFIDAEEDYEENAIKEVGWTETFVDALAQAGLGAWKSVTWPADVLKYILLEEGLSSVDELENAAFNAGVSFDKTKYVNSVIEASDIVPTQEMAEKLLERITGVSLEPKTETGKRTKQIANIASLQKGSLVRKGITGLAAGATTEAAKQLGVPEGPAELIGDIASVGTNLVNTQRIPRRMTPEIAETERISRRYGLPFLEAQAKENRPSIDANVSKATGKRINELFNISTAEAIDNVINDEFVVKRLRDRGVNLEGLSEQAYGMAFQSAREHPVPMNTGRIVNNINQEINRIERLAPSPSNAQQQALRVLEDQRDILMVSNPTPEQLLNQHINYNSNVKSIYAKPEFRGAEDEVRRAYAFLNDQLVDTVERQGNPRTAELFRASNKIYSERMKLDQTERILCKTFEKGKYNPNKLRKTINGRDGKFLRRNISQQGIDDIQEISKYGEDAINKINDFVSIDDPKIRSVVGNWGQLATILFAPTKLTGAGIVLAQDVSSRVIGNLLVRPATRTTLRTIFRNASAGDFNLLQKDFAILEKEINEEYGSIDTYMQVMMSDLENYVPLSK